MQHNILWSTDIQRPSYLWDLEGDASTHVLAGEWGVLRHEDIDFEHSRQVDHIKTAGAPDRDDNHLGILGVVLQEEGSQRLSMFWAQCRDEISIQGGTRHA